MHRFLFSVILLACFTQLASAQGGDSLSTRRIHILRADRMNLQQPDSLNQLQSLAGNVMVQQEQTIVTCDSAVLNVKTNVLEAFGRIHINDADSIHTYADYLRYVGNEKKAYLRKNVKLTDGQGTLTTTELVYDVNTKIATYMDGGRVVSGKSVLTSREGMYYGDTKDVYFRRNVHLKNPEYDIRTDSLLYNTSTERATFISRTEIVSGKRRIITREGYYDTKTRQSYFSRRPLITDSCYVLQADEVARDEASGFGEARGTVIFKDTCQGFTILANNLKSNEKNAAFLATINPVMIIRQDGDSIFVAADTLYSAQLSELLRTREVPSIDTAYVYDAEKLKKDSNANRFFEAYRNVRVFSDSMQAVSDSLFYSFYDSAFRLFTNPVIWANDNQLTGDTMYLFTRNRKMSHLRAFENAMAINKVSAEFYNQVKGRTITGYFRDGNIETFRAKGNAELVYYTTDEENRFIGVNKSSSDLINVWFVNRKTERVSFIKDVKGTLYPMRQVNHEEIKLRGFKIQEDRRPKTKFELFGR